MPNIVKLTCENADELLNASAYGAGAVIQVQAGSAEAGPFADDGTVALVSGTRAYTYFDADGTSSTWYRTRFENAGGTTASDWSAVFQAGDELAGGICSLYDAKQRLFGANAASITAEDEDILGYIGQATRFIENRTKRWFVPRSSRTLLFSPETTSRSLRFPKGIRALTALAYATTDQPDTGGVYTAIASTDWSLQPSDGERDDGWPATSIRLLDTAGALFYAGINRVQATLLPGFAAVPGDVEKVGLNLVVAAHRERGTSGGGDSITVNIDGSKVFERSLSYSDRMTLDWYAVRVVG